MSDATSYHLAAWFCIVSTVSPHHFILCMFKPHNILSACPSISVSKLLRTLVNNNKFLNCCWMDYDSQQMVATMLFQSAIQLSHHVCIKWIQVVTCLSLRHAQTLDKNGSLIDPSGTESPHVQIWLETMQVQVVDQTTHPPKCHSFVALDRQISASPPARRREKKERFYIYLFRCYTHRHTHTHLAGTGKTLKGKGERKADTNNGPRPKQRRGGGEQTDLQNQPTRRDGPNQHRAHTWTPQHIPQGHGGRIRDRMGD